jgi:hypothetical protein
LKQNEIVGISRFYLYAVLAISFFVGEGIGFFLSFYVLFSIFGVPFSMDKPIDQMGVPRFATYVALIGGPLGTLGIAIPLFLLFLKPFYTRKAMIDFALSRKNENELEEALKQYLPFLILFVKRICDYWFDLIFP